MRQPPAFSVSASGSAHTASSKSRASLPSIVTSARSRRSARPARSLSGRAAAASASAAAGKTAGMSCAAIIRRLIAPGALAGPRRSTMRARLPKRRDGSSSATTSSASGRPAASWPSTWYSALSRRSAATITPPSRVPLKTPTMRFPAASMRRTISASISPVSRRISRASARPPIASSAPASPTSRKPGAPSSVTPAGRTSAKPSGSLP